jgi:hypothetical protein
VAELIPLDFGAADDHAHDRPVPPPPDHLSMMSV